MPITATLARQIDQHRGLAVAGFECMQRTQEEREAEC